MDGRGWLVEGGDEETSEVLPTESRRLCTAPLRSLLERLDAATTAGTTAHDHAGVVLDLLADEAQRLAEEMRRSTPMPR